MWSLAAHNCVYRSIGDLSDFAVNAEFLCPFHDKELYVSDTKIKHNQYNTLAAS